jgi:integrase
MALYKSKWRDPKTGELKTSSTWWYEFTFAGQRIRESANTTRKTLAIEAERNRRLELEKAIIGTGAEVRVSRMRRVRDLVKEYLEAYPINHRPDTVRFAKTCLKVVTRLLGDSMLVDLTEARMRSYILQRLESGVCGRTINIELGELSRVIGKKWRELWPNLRKLEERKDIGKALSPEEEYRLVTAAWASKSPLLGPYVSIALMTGMRSGEILGLRWGQIDLQQDIVTVGQAKTKAGSGRTIPMNEDLATIFENHAAWYQDRIGEIQADHFLFPIRRVGSIYDPHTRIVDITAAWDLARIRAGVRCRFHDLRHCAATKMAEAGVPESTMLALMGHTSRAMLERYSHIRMAAKRNAVESLGLKRPSAEEVKLLKGVPKDSPKGGKNGVFGEGPKLLNPNGGPCWIRTNNQQIMSLLH